MEADESWDLPQIWSFKFGNVWMFEALKCSSFQLLKLRIFSKVQASSL